MANPQLPPPKVLIADPISTRGVEELSREGALDVHVQTGLTSADLLQRIPEFSALVVRSETKVTAEVFRLARNPRKVAIARE
jgi:D-3-phosphoglycerate dehydrogenase